VTSPFKLFPLAFALALGSVACSTVQSAIQAPGRFVRKLAPGEEPMPRDVDAVSLRLMRFADVSAIKITKACESFAVAATTPEARIQALSWQVDYTRALWRLASGPQPYEGLFSSILVVTAVRRAHETHWLSVWGEPDRVMLDTFLDIERDAWSLATAIAGEAHVEEARSLIQRWVERYGDAEAKGVNALPAFGEIFDADGERAGGPGLLTLITFDPLSGLEPAVAEVEQSRQLAERALYYLQHLPTLLTAQVELTGLRSTQSPAIKGALSDWERLSAASASFAATAEGLPATLSAEREALLAQLGSEITAQREGLLRDLETAREPLNEILSQTQGTAVAGREMSDSTKAAFEAGTVLSRAIDEMVASLRNGGGPPDPSRPPGRRFDITEYTAAADSLAKGAQSLTETSATLDRSLPQLQALVREAIAQSDRAVDRAFRRALQLLVIGLLGAAIVALAVRRITMHWNARERGAGTG